jgi:hypothetical protein
MTFLGLGIFAFMGPFPFPIKYIYSGCYCIRIKTSIHEQDSTRHLLLMKKSKTFVPLGTVPGHASHGTASSCLL